MTVQTIDQLVTRLQALDQTLPPSDGVRWSFSGGSWPLARRPRRQALARGGALARGARARKREVARAAHHTGPGAAVEQPSRTEM